MSEGSAKAPNKSTPESVPVGRVADMAQLLFELGDVVQRVAKLDKVFEKLPAIARSMIFAKIFLATVGSASAQTPDVDVLQEALNNAARSYISEQVSRGNEAKEADAAQVEQQFQAFLDQIQPHTSATRELFGEHPTAMEQRAIRFAFGNVFVEFDNAITEQHLTSAKDYDARLAAVLGAPAGIDDVLQEEFRGFHSAKAEQVAQLESSEGATVPLDDLNTDGTPRKMGPGIDRFERNMSPEYASFVRTLFIIYRSEQFNTLRDIVKDKGQMFAFEILLHPSFATPEELVWAKETARLEQMLGLMNPGIANRAMT